MNKKLICVTLLALAGCNSHEQVPNSNEAATAKGMAVISARQEKLKNSDKELEKIMSTESSSPQKEKK